MALSKQVIELLIKLSAGDLRRAITLLQSAARLHAAEDPPTPITCESGASLPLDPFSLSSLYPRPSLTLLALAVQEMSGIVPTSLVGQLLDSVGVSEADGYLGPAFTGSFERTQKAVKRVKREGWSAGTVLNQVRSAPPACSFALRA